MANRIGRRTWFAQTLACTAALATARGARAIEPIQRNGAAKFKLSLAAYSYRDLLTAKQDPLTLFDFIHDCAELGLEGTELTSYYFPAEITPEYLRKVKSECFLLGLDISGTPVSNDFGIPKGEERDRSLAHVKKWVDYSELLGSPCIRVFAGHVPENSSAEDAHKRIVDGLEECCDYAGQHGVYLALENHGGPTATVDGLMAIVRDVKSPWFGVNLDTGNFRSDDVYGDLAKAAPYTITVQVKVMISNTAGKREASDFQRLAQILRDSGYRGYIALEFEEAGEPRSECRKYIKEMREAFG